jgi:hypothetical protein
VKRGLFGLIDGSGPKDGSHAAGWDIVDCGRIPFQRRVALVPRRADRPPPLPAPPEKSPPATTRATRRRAAGLPPTS